MLISLPIAVLVVLWIALVGHASDERLGWRGALLKAFVIWSTLIALVSEGLGALKWIRRPELAVSWSIMLALVLGWGLRSGHLRRGRSRLSRLRLPHSWAERSLLLGMLVLAGMLFAVGFKSPANNVDSLHYHMARVMHWAQDGSLAHYAASYHPQLLYPDWAETAILNLRVLWGSDQPAALVQWFSMLVSVIAASALAELLGAGRRAQLAAAAFAVSIPMGVLQATSTQNDYAVAMWALAVAYWTVLSWQRRSTSDELPYLAASTGLGMLTKATFAVFALPFLVSYLWTRARQQSVGRSTGAAAFLVLGVVVLNFGVWQRNLRTYGGLYGSPDQVGAELAFPSALASARDSARRPDGEIDLPAAGSRVLGWGIRSVGHAVALNLTSPSQLVNTSLWNLLDHLPGLVGRGTLEVLQNAAWNHEDTAGNPVHLALVPIALAALLLGRPRRLGPAAPAYASMSLLGFLLLQWAISLAGSPFGVRLQLPFFILWAPVFGAALERFGRRGLSGMTAAVLLLAAVPYALLNNTRPVIGRPPWPTRVHSVFTAPAAEIAFAASPGLRAPFTQAASEIGAMSCHQVGLRIDSGELEYLIWWLLDAPQSGVRLEVVDPLPLLARLADSGFRPCAVICTICGERVELNGMPLRRDFGYVRLYAAAEAELGD